MVSVWRIIPVLSPCILRMQPQLWPFRLGHAPCPVSFTWQGEPSRSSIGKGLCVTLHLHFVITTKLICHPMGLSVCWHLGLFVG